MTISLLSGISGALGQSGCNTCKPWTYWWWMGSSVNQEDIKKQLEEFSRIGIGGVHIIPKKPESVPWQYFSGRDTLYLNNPWTVNFISENHENLKSRVH